MQVGKPPSLPSLGLPTAPGRATSVPLAPSPPPVSGLAARSSSPTADTMPRHRTAALPPASDVKAQATERMHQLMGQQMLQMFQKMTEERETALKDLFEPEPDEDEADDDVE